MVESGRVLENHRIPREYREMVESVRVPKNDSGEYRKMVESRRVPKNRKILANIGKW